MRIALLVLTASAALSLSACDRSAGPAAASAASPPNVAVAQAPAASPTIPYRFDQPIAYFRLPEGLKEISGLTVLDDRTLGAVQDEEGRLYVISQETGDVTAVIPFGPPGDYEGLELAAGRLFILRADGVLVEIEGWQGGATRSQTYTLELPTDCDAEGLGYDPAEGRLLIACKEEGGNAIGNRKAVFALQLDEWALGRTPAFVLDSRALDRERELKPAAIAVHPVTGHVMVLSSTLPVLVSLAPDGTVAQAWDLSAARMEQPEGIAFLPGGDLFIASEGDDGPPLLMRFAYEGTR
jgi:uncharacterized protein YjiK